MGHVFHAFITAEFVLVLSKLSAYRADSDSIYLKMMVHAYLVLSIASLVTIKVA